MIQLNHIHKAFGKKVIFDQMSATFDQPGKVYAILGASGSGKTTLLHMLFGLDRDFTGSYTLFGRNASELTNRDWDGIRSSRMQLVYQDDKLLGDFTVEDNLKFALNDPHQGEEAIRQALTRMDLLELTNQKVKKLSGGEKQRLALARAALNHPEILLLDEPTGNLDDANTHIVMEYVQKLADEDCMIVIITHDSRVMEYSDFVYRLEQKTLVPQGPFPSQTDKPVKMDWKENKLPSRNGGRYAFKSVISNVVDLVLHNIPITAIFVVFIILFNFFLGMSHVTLDLLVGGISDRAILLDLWNVKDEVIAQRNQEGITLAASDGKRLNFSQEDVDNVLAIDGVVDVLAENVSSSAIDDSEDYTLDWSLPLEELPQEVTTSPGAAAAQKSVTVSFQSMSIPNQWLDYYNPNHLTLLAGNFPAQSSDELMLSDVIAYYEAQRQGCSITDLVGKQMELEVSKYLWQDGERVGEDTKIKSYTICGIYQTDFRQSLDPMQILYLGYRPDRYNTEVTQQDYEAALEEYQQMNPQSQAFCREIYQDLAHYQQARGLGCSQLLIAVESPGQVEQVSQQLGELFPNLKQLSLYDAQHGDLAGIYWGTFQLFLTVMTILVVIFGIIITFLTKGHIKRKNKQMSILYSLGYSRWQVSRIILYENLMQTALDLAVAYLVVVPVYLCWLQYSTVYKYFGQTLTVTSILGVCGFGVLMMAFSIAWAVFGVRKKKLKKYLSG